MKILESAENYLETILILQKRNGSVRSIDIASELEFTKPSVSIAMKHLRENGYIEMDKNGHITLLESGRSIAEAVYEDRSNLDLTSRDGQIIRSGITIVEPSTGNVVAIVGGIGAKKGNRILNRATNITRPLGSVIKPLSVYAPAIDSRVLSYSSVFDDVPQLNNGVIWPKNSPDVYHGLTDLEYAISHSLNTYAVHGLTKLGIDNSYNFLKNKLGFVNLTENDRNVAPLALGQLTYGESLKTVTSAYTMMQNGGYISNPRTYYSVTDSYGNIILENKKAYERVISEEAASIMNNLLSSVTREGTARGTALKDRFSVAGKTGTSGNSYDKWFVGYTPYYVCGVWVGYDTPKSVAQNGKSPSINLFDAIMNEAHKDKSPNAKLFSSRNVTVAEYCRDSGLSPCEECRLDPRLNRINKGYFIKGTEPNGVCNLHKGVYIDTATGMIAGRETSYLLKRKIALLDYERSLIINDKEILDSRFTLGARQ